MKKPFTLKLLAGIGILIGSMSAMYAAFSARLFLLDQDQFVQLFEDEVQPSPAASPSPEASPSPAATPAPEATPAVTPAPAATAPAASAAPETSPSPVAAVSPPPKADEVAQKLYQQRGVVLPMAAMDIILSMLLLAGCLRALRGTAWGASAWKFACLLFLPYQALNLLHAIKLDELHPAYVAAWAVACFYYLISIWYLRRPQIASLFR